MIRIAERIPEGIEGEIIGESTKALTNLLETFGTAPWISDLTEMAETMGSSKFEKSSKSLGKTFKTMVTAGPKAWIMEKLMGLLEPFLNLLDLFTPILDVIGAIIQQALFPVMQSLLPLIMTIVDILFEFSPIIDLIIMSLMPLLDLLLDLIFMFIDMMRETGALDAIMWLLKEVIGYVALGVELLVGWIRDLIDWINVLIETELEEHEKGKEEREERIEEREEEGPAWWDIDIPHGTLLFQHGGHVTSPTLGLLGEAEKSSEWIFNDEQLKTITQNIERDFYTEQTYYLTRELVAMTKKTTRRWNRG